jgi:hypothetical protein
MGSSPNVEKCQHAKTMYVILKNISLKITIKLILSHQEIFRNEDHSWRYFELKLSSC